MKVPDTWIQLLRETRWHRDQTDLQKHFRNVAIFRAYYTTDASLQSLAQEYGLSREYIRQIVRCYLILIYKVM